MSIYPPAVTAQELYEASDIQRHKLGTLAVFDSANGLVQAMYCRNEGTATIAAGLVVGPGGSLGIGYCGTVIVAANSSFQEARVLGGLAASLNNSTAGGYAWVIVRGPQTNAFLGVSAASSSAIRLLGANSSAQLVTVAATDDGVAMMRITTTVASGTANGTFIDWLWG